MVRFTSRLLEYGKQVSKSLETGNEGLRNGHGRMGALDYDCG